jgi:hypothetical protein
MRGHALRLTHCSLRWVAKRDDDETTWEPARECRSARVWWTDRELELELAAAQQEAHRIEQLEALRGRSGGRMRRRSSNKSGSGQLSDSDSDDELDFDGTHPGDLGGWHHGKIEFGSDDDGVDELFESEQGGPVLVS